MALCPKNQPKVVEWGCKSGVYFWDRSKQICEPRCPLNRLRSRCRDMLNRLPSILAASDEKQPFAGIGYERMEMSLQISIGCTQTLIVLPRMRVSFKLLRPHRVERFWLYPSIQYSPAYQRHRDSQTTNLLGMQRARVLVCTHCICLEYEQPD